MTTIDDTRLSTGTWTIDTAHSEIGFAVRHLGLSKVRGRFNSFSGTARIGERLTDSTIEATIDLASVATNNPQRDEHLRSADFLDVDANPPMSFRSTSIDGSAGQVTGELTINGITVSVTLDTVLHGVAVDAYGTTRAGVSASTEIRRSDFDIDVNVPLDAGAVLIGDKVAIELEIQLMPTEDLA